MTNRFTRNRPPKDDEPIPESSVEFGEFIDYRCCRYCWGVDNQYQYTQAELRAAYQNHNAKYAKLPEAKRPLFDEEGGDGFDQRKDPQRGPEWEERSNDGHSCPECNGVGNPVVEPLNTPKPEKPKSNAGRPTGYRPEFAERVYNYSLLGLTDEQMVKCLGCSVPTFYAWQKKHPEFVKATRAGKMEADAKLAVRTYNAAMGYSHPDTKIFRENGRTVIVPTVKHYPPDTNLAWKWLANRHPDKFKDRKSVELTGADGGPVDVRVTEIVSRVIDADFTDITDAVITAPKVRDARAEPKSVSKVKTRTV